MLSHSNETILLLLFEAGHVRNDEINYKVGIYVLPGGPTSSLRHVPNQTGTDGQLGGCVMYTFRSPAEGAVETKSSNQVETSASQISMPASQ